MYTMVVEPGLSMRKNDLVVYEVLGEVHGEDWYIWTWKTRYVNEACTTSKVYLDPGAGGVLAIEGGRATIWTWKVVFKIKIIYLINFQETETESQSTKTEKESQSTWTALPFWLGTGT